MFGYKSVFSRMATLWAWHWKALGGGFTEEDRGITEGGGYGAHNGECQVGEVQAAAMKQQHRIADSINYSKVLII